MCQNYTHMKNLILDRFLRYVQIDTQSEFAVDKIPSTDKQFILANMLKAELEEMGMRARRFVRENFLITRHLREYLTLMVGLTSGDNERIRVGNA